MQRIIIVELKDKKHHKCGPYKQWVTVRTDKLVHEISVQTNHDSSVVHKVAFYPPLTKTFRVGVEIHFQTENQNQSAPGF